MTQSALSLVLFVYSLTGAVELHRGDIIVRSGTEVVRLDPLTGLGDIITTGSAYPNLGGAEGFWMELDTKSDAIYFTDGLNTGVVGKIDPAGSPTTNRTVESGPGPGGMVGSGPYFGYSFFGDFSVHRNGQLYGFNNGELLRVDPVTGDRFRQTLSEPVYARSGDLVGNTFYTTTTGYDLVSVDILTGQVQLISQNSDWSGAALNPWGLAVVDDTTAYASTLNGMAILEIDLQTGQRDVLYEVPTFAEDPVEYQNYHGLGFQSSDMAVDLQGRLLFRVAGFVGDNVAWFDLTTHDIGYLSGEELLGYNELNQPIVVTRGYGRFSGGVRSLAVYVPEVPSPFLMFGGLLVLVAIRRWF